MKASHRTSKSSQSSQKYKIPHLKSLVLFILLLALPQFLAPNSLAQTENLSFEQALTEASVIENMDSLTELFNKLKEDSSIPFDYIEGGCYARAEKMCLDLDIYHINSCKIFVEGDLKVATKHGTAEWWFHVAPIVLLNENGSHKPYVLDPSLFDRPVPVSEWISLQTDNMPARVKAIQVTKKFAFSPDKLNQKAKDYPLEDIKMMFLVFEVEKALLHH